MLVWYRDRELAGIVPLLRVVVSFGCVMSWSVVSSFVSECSSVVCSFLSLWGCHCDCPGRGRPVLPSTIHPHRWSHRGSMYGALG